MQKIKSVQEGDIKKKLQNDREFEIELNHSSVSYSKRSDNILAVYEKTPIRSVGASQDFYYASKAKISDVLVKVVSCEGPIHRDEARRRVIQHWGMNNVKSAIRSIMQGVERFSTKGNKIVRKGKFFWPLKMKQVKIRFRDINGIMKKIELICPEEIEESFKFVLKKEFSIPYDNLITQTAKLLGFNRTGEGIYSSLGKRLDNLIKREVVLRKDERLFLANKIE